MAIDDYEPEWTENIITAISEAGRIEKAIDRHMDAWAAFARSAIETSPFVFDQDQYRFKPREACEIADIMMAEYETRLAALRDGKKTKPPEA
jgi:hypothetical protein